jgi:uncharacterized protein (TIGR03382 family)
VTVNITFHNATSGLGSNNPNRTSYSYTSYRAALVTHSTTADDAVALAHLAAGPNNPADGTANVWVCNPLARALGLAVAGGTDDTIDLNTGICFLNHNSPQSGLYDLYAVACHEMDEALGSISGINFLSGPAAADMFRYNGTSHTYDTNTGHHAYFSIDGGNTNIVEWNQSGRTSGDWGDWIVHNPPQVQDWEGTPGVKIDMGSSELRLLDVVGYNVVPAPTTASVLALGMLSALRRRRS